MVGEKKLEPYPIPHDKKITNEFYNFKVHHRECLTTKTYKWT